MNWDEYLEEGILCLNIVRYKVSDKLRELNKEIFELHSKIRELEKINKELQSANDNHRISKT